MNFVRLLKNIPLRINEERSDQLASSHPRSWLRIHLSAHEYLICPDDALVVAIWRFHSFSRGGRTELKNFLKLAEGCNRLLDLGASAGIFSALFSNTRENPEILSVEPDERSFDLLSTTIENNGQTNSNWRTIRAVATDHPGSISFLNGAFGGKVSETGEGENVMAHSLESLSNTFNFVPDIIKLDVESYEYEILMGGLSWLEAHRPRLFLELHWNLLKERGISPRELLDSLSGIGYLCHRRSDFSSSFLPHLDQCGVARLPLIAASSR